MKISEVKRYVDYLSLMEYNTLELYTEDTLVIEGEPYFGYLRGPYTAAEVKDLDEYARKKCIELIPCIQTLAHFTNVCKIPKYQHLFDIEELEAEVLPSLDRNRFKNHLYKELVSTSEI